MNILDLFVSKTNRNDEIYAIADGKMIDIAGVKDEVFSQKMMGDGIAFEFEDENVTLCSPADGELSVLFPTGHAFGVSLQNGVELLVHCGINTVEANGIGFALCSRKQGDKVKTGDPIVKVNLKDLRKRYDMTTMLIAIETNGYTISFENFGNVKKGQSIARIV